MSNQEGPTFFDANWLTDFEQTIWQLRVAGADIVAIDGDQNEVPRKHNEHVQELAVSLLHRAEPRRDYREAQQSDRVRGRLEASTSARVGSDLLMSRNSAELVAQAEKASKMVGGAMLRRR